MKKNTYFLILATLCGIVCLNSCTSKQSTVEVIDVNGSELYVCNYNNVKDSITIPLSELIESLQIVKLDTAQDALIKGGPVVISENYIGIKPWDQSPFKLFDKEGHFLRNIGAVGKGPNEYINLYCTQIDETNGRVYLLPWQTKQLLRYDLEGNAFEPVQLACELPKGRFTVRGNEVEALALPFKDAVPYVAFRQTLDGELLGKVDAAPYAIGFDFSNEIMSNNNDGSLNFYIFQFFNQVQDTIYRYNAAENRLQPLFTANFGQNKIPLHSLGNFSHYYYIETMETEQSEYGLTTKNPKYVIVDKDKKEANFFKIENDLLGGLGVTVYDFQDGLFVQNFPAIKLKEALEKATENSNLTEAAKARINELLSNLNEDDNNVILWGKLK